VHSDDGSGQVPRPEGYKFSLGLYALCEIIPLTLVVRRNSESVGDSNDLPLEHVRDVP